MPLKRRDLLPPPGSLFDELIRERRIQQIMSSTANIVLNQNCKLHKIPPDRMVGACSVDAG